VVSYLALLPMGFAMPRRSLAERWALTPPFHPYRWPKPAAVYSLWHFPSIPRLRDRPRVSSTERPLARTMLGYAASRPLEFGLSSPISRLRDRSDSPPFQNLPESITPSGKAHNA
jgi:hypothetical protein